MLWSSAFQPVRRCTLVRMRKPCGADDKYGADDWTRADEKTLLCCYKHILNSLSLLNHPIVFS